MAESEDRISATNCPLPEIQGEKNSQGKLLWDNLWEKESDFHPRWKAYPVFLTLRECVVRNVNVPPCG